MAKISVSSAPGTTSDTEVRHFWDVRFSLLGEIIDRAIERGELPPGTERKPLVERLLGGIYLRLLVTREPVDDSFLVGLADFLAAQRAAPRSHP